MRSERRSLDAFDTPEPQHRRRHRRARGAGTDDGIRSAIAHEVRRDEHGCTPFSPQGLGGRLPHGDDLGGVLEADARRLSGAVLGYLAPDPRDVADEDHLIGVGSGVGDRTTHDLARSEVAAHGIDGDPHRSAARAKVSREPQRAPSVGGAVSLIAIACRPAWYPQVGQA